MIEITDKETGEVKLYTDEAFYAERDVLLLAWEAAKLALETAKQNEMKLRKEVVSFAFDPAKTTGTERIDLGNGWQAKAVKKINYGWIKEGDKVNKHAIDNALDAIEKTVENGALVAERLVKWTPELSQTEYKLLPSAAKAIIDSVIVTTEGTPTLEVVPPKAPK